MKTYNDVVAEFDQFRALHPDDPTDLPEFAKQMDVAQGVADRAEAYKERHWAAGVNDAINKAFDWTPNADLIASPRETGRTIGGAIGGGFDRLTGTHIAPTLEMLGEETPRMVVEGIATAPLGGAGAIPRALSIASKVGKVAGYGSAFARGAADTGNTAGGLVSAGSLGLGNVLIPKAGAAAEGAITRMLEKSVPDVTPEAVELAKIVGPSVLQPTTGAVRSGVGELANLGAGIGTATGINEATRQATLTTLPDEMRVEGDRDPFTQENIAANVGGAAFFLPQLMTSLVKGGPKVSPKQTQQLVEMLKKEGDVPPATTAATVPPAGEVAPAAAGGPPEALFRILEDSVAARKLAVEDGRTDDVTGLDTNIEETYNKLVSGDYGALDAASRERVKGNIDKFNNVVKAVQPDTPQKFQDLATLIREDLNRMSENKLVYEQERARREEVLNTNDRKAVAEHKVWVAEQERRGSGRAGQEQTWHPQARRAEVLDQLWKSGELPPLSDAWLQKEWQVVFDESGNPQMSNRVLSQKLSNYYADNMDAAVERAKVSRKAADVPGERKGGEVDAQRARFFASLEKLPKQYLRDVLKRTVEISNAERIDPRSGQPVTRVKEWERAVMRAAESYDPQTGQILLPHAGKPGEGPVFRMHQIEDLFGKDANGQYTWTPQERRVSKSEGGKALVETNIESLRKPSGDEVEIADEEAFKRALAERSSGEGLFGTERDPGADLVLDQTNKLDEPTVDAIDESAQRSADALGDMMQKKTETLKKNLASLSDDQLWKLAEGVFRIKNSVHGAQKKADLRLALTAALENLKGSKGRLSEAGKQFLAKQRAAGLTGTKGKGDVEDVKRFLRGYFQESKPIMDSTSKLPNDQQRIATIVGKLLDEKTVARVKSGGPTPLAQENAGNRPSQVSADGTPLAHGEGVESPGILTNRHAPGEFVADVHKTLRTRIEQLLGRAGYSGTTKEFYTELGVALAQQGALTNVDFFRVDGPQYGMAGPEYQGRGALGLDVTRKISAGDEAKAVLQLVETLGHEIGHLDGFIADGFLQRPDAYSDERARLIKNFKSFGDALTPDERQGILTVVAEYLPEQLRLKILQPDGKPYGTDTADEFAQQIRGAAMSMLAHDSPKGRATAAEMMSYLPTEVRELWRDTFRTSKDIMEVMKQAVSDPESRLMAGDPNVLTANTDPFIMSKSFDTMLYTAKYMTSMRYADRAMADARTFMDNMRAPTLGLTNSVWYTKEEMPTQIKNQQSFPERPSDTAVEATQAVDHFLNGPRAYEKTQQLGLVGRFLAPFRHEMWAMERNGNPVARPIADAVFQLESGAHRILSGLLEPYMKRGADGSVKFDAENPLIKRIAQERTGPFRDAVNKVGAWQQETHEMVGQDPAKKTYLDAQTMFVQDANGTITTNPAVKGAQAAWDKIRANLSKEDQQFVMNESVVLDKVGQRGRDILMKSISDSNVNRTASLLQAMNKQMPAEQAMATARQVHDAFLSGNVLSLQGTIPPKQIEILGRLLNGPDGKSGLLGSFKEVGQHFDNRPGYRSESLPHDWVIRYRNAENDVKFTSRPTEAAALAEARRLQAAGNRIDGEIVNRKDVNTFSKADDPDGILVKVTERENFVWNKFVEEMTAKHGPQFGEELKGGYTPMETTMRDVTAAGIGKFLKERKGFVDREAHDYIDSTMSYTERLAYAVAVRTMKQRVELLLNDLSVRLQPKFQNLVRGHMSEMLRPQTQTLKEMKGIVTGLMIGGNLGSVAANAMQSLSTLVPVLDLMNGASGGSFVKPWKQMGRAIADATDYTLGHDWKRLAAETKGIDPTKWSEDQTVAELWRRHVEAGGFTHTVVDDLVYGQDQRMLSNAKFGRGDYGPVTRAEMLRSGAYLANQFAMKPFRWVEHGNAKVAFLAGVRQAFEQGLRGDAAYAKAAQVQGLATFGGGRANASGLQTALSKGFTPGGAGLALSLQQYGFGLVAMHGQFVRDAIGKSKGLSASEVWHARRAYGTYLMTQTALAGALGFPLVGAALTVLEKVFGIPANQAVRQGLASLGSDDESGATIAEIGLNGFADYWTGLDVSSRIGTSSLLGTSSYRGFNLSDLAGPVGSILENGVKSLGYFAHGEPMRAATALAPVALKRAIEMTDSQNKYGDNGIRDAAGNLQYMPTDRQATAYMFGIRPRELSRRRQLGTALQTADTITLSSRDRELNDAAQELMRGNPARAQSLGQEAMYVDPMNGMQTTLRAIMDRAVAAQSPKDMLATGSKWNEEERSQIYRTFGKDIAPRQSELQIQELRMQMARALGDPRIAPTIESYKQAAVVDSLVAGGTMTRSEAVRFVQMMGL